ncbi:MAG: rimM [Bacillus sp. (in: firmicutes)]|jgi:16S rRNA processing protein RimM|nr:rimM [Bacillus sp. (in: firmicutes)]
MDKWFNVGKIVNVHGLKGEVRVISTTDFVAQRFKPGNHLFLFMPGANSNSPIELKVVSHRTHKNFELLTFEGFEDVNLVEKFRDGILKVPEDQLGALDEGEFYFHEIVGCLVCTVHGEEIGKVTEILTPGANDVWVIKPKTGRDILIPYIAQVVKKIDVKEKIILIEPMEGLLS